MGCCYRFSLFFQIAAHYLAPWYIKGKNTITINPTSPSSITATTTSSSFCPLLHLLPFSSSTTSSGEAIPDLDNAPATVEKRGRGHPRGSKNKVKATTAASSSTVLGKHHHGRPLDSKNKKPSTVAVGASIAPDLDSTQPILPKRSPEKLFCFIAFVDAQCHERQRLPLKFAEFMDVRKISHTIDTSILHHYFVS
jgi:hypothetical protein